VISPAQGARIAAFVEAAYEPGVMYPELPPELAGDYDLIDYLTAKDALLALQQFGVGERVFYGWMLRDKQDPTQYVVAIRGTENGTEWASDALAVLVNHVHLGFFSIYSSMTFRGSHPAEGITETIPPDSTVTIVGHSLGAPLACYLVNDLIGKRDCYGLFYAMPKPGDAVFADQFKASEARYSVFDYAPDIVPTLPANLPLHRFVPLHDVTVLPKSPQIPDNIVSNHSASNYMKLLEGMNANA